MCLGEGWTPQAARDATRDFEAALTPAQEQDIRDCYEVGPGPCRLGIRHPNDLAAYCYKNAIPGLGICLGEQQLMLVQMVVGYTETVSKLALMTEFGLIGGPLDLGEAAVEEELAVQALNLPFKSPSLRSQIEKVVGHFDEFGESPTGVAQGGLKGFPKGTYGNKNELLPVQPNGYYTESDVWASGAGVKRGPERLIFGRGGEVYYSPDHYESFVRIR